MLLSPKLTLGWNKLFKYKQDARLKELYFMVEELRISLFSTYDKNSKDQFATRLQKYGTAWNQLRYK